MSSGLWMDLSWEEYRVLSYILFNIGPDGSFLSSPQEISQVLGIEEARVREIIENLARKRLIRIIKGAGAEREVPSGALRLFDIFQDTRGENETLSYLRKEVRSAYLALIRSVRELIKTSQVEGKISTLHLERALYYNNRLEGYRNLGVVVANRTRMGALRGDLGFEDKLRSIYQISLYLYPMVTLIARRMKSPLGEEVTVYVPSMKALQSRIRSIDQTIADLEGLLRTASGKYLLRGIYALIIGFKREKEILEKLSEALERLMG
ncbi:MAG: hypothetical protein F7C35_06115 [Desulfurococcales archaeon]|nr:hypothetical protein [Desulfurococcales archaeon]